MAKQGSLKFIGTVGDVVYYQWRDLFCARGKSTLSGERVRKSPEFRNTMKHARLLGKASGIASQLYAEIPKTKKQYWMFRALTGNAMQWLKAGKTADQVRHYLREAIAAFFEIKIKKSRSCISTGLMHLLSGKPASAYKTIVTPLMVSLEYLKISYDMVFKERWREWLEMEKQFVKETMDAC